MTTRLTDEMIRTALRPGPDVAAPDRFVSAVMAAIGTAETTQGQNVARPPSGARSVPSWKVDPDPRTIRRTRNGTGMPWRRLLVLATLLLIATVTAVLVGSLLPVPREPRPTGVFEPTGQIPNASDLQRPAIATLADGRVLVAGGNTDYVITAVLYDPATETYGEPILMGAPRWDATATTLQDGRVLVVGGISPGTSLAQVTTEVFDPATATFTTTASMAEARGSHTATLLDDGRVLVAGGSLMRESSPGSQSYVAEPIGSVELYEPARDTFATANPMTVARVGHTATLLSDGNVLIVGGYGVAADGTYAATGSAEIFDPRTETIKPAGLMGTPRAGHTATRLPDGRVLVVGGGTAFDSDGYANRVSQTAEIYDPETDSFAPTGPLRTERTKHSATLLADGRVLVAGGSNPFGSPLTTELFDPATGAFDAGPKATSEHRFAIAPLLPDGRVFFPESWGSEIYDPEGGPESGATAPPSPAPRSTAPGAFQPVATTVRSGHTATQLVDGRVLIAGGSGGPDQAALSTAEIFDPRSETFSPTGSMAVARVFAVTTRLPDGRVLVAGGDSTDADTAEVYDPSSGTFGPASPEIGRLLEDGGVGSIRGLADGTLLLQRYVEGTETAHVERGPDTHRCHRRPRDRVHRPPPDPHPVWSGPARRTLRPGDRSHRIGRHPGDWVAATPLADGRVVLASGRPDREDLTAVLSITAVYDPAAGTLDDLSAGPSTPMTGRRRNEQHGSMTELTDGTVLLAGGFRGSSDSAWLVDPGSGTSHDAGPMLAAREQPSVTALDDGRALIVGGVTLSPDRSDRVPPAAELFDARGSR